MGGRRLEDGREWSSLDELARHALDGGARLLPAPPFMHGAAQWMAFSGFANGATVVLPARTDRFDALDTLRTVQRERVEYLLIVGDAFGRPLADAAEVHELDLSSLLVIINGGATLSSRTAQRLLSAAPTALLLDGLGSSETGSQASRLHSPGSAVPDGTFVPGEGTCVLSEQLDRVLEPGSGELGWLAQHGRVPLGYLGDEARTAATFPSVGGVRHAVAGDRARLLADGSIELLGRDAVTINTGGEKVFAEEVERALLQHPAVVDCVVAGRPSERWGDEVVAIVQVAEPAPGDADLLEVAARHVARYKLPKAIIRRAALRRSPSGKADYRWAREVATGAGSGGAAAPS
jgi:fatty-acyl-CoA synthase